MMNPEDMKLLGRLEGQMAMLIKDLATYSTNTGKLFDSLNKVNATIAKLPCNDHTRILKNLVKWQDACSSNNGAIKLARFEGNVQLRNTAITCLITLFTGIIGTIAALYFAGVISH